MFENFIKIAYRNFWKNKTYSLVNIIGLAIGLGCFILILLYVLDEISFDQYNKRSADIYRINADIRFGGTDLHLPVTSDMMGEVLKKDYPEVEQYARIYNSNGSKLIKKEDQFINEINVANVDSGFFEMFTLPAIYGNTKSALTEPNAVVLTESTAKKYFGRVDVLGKTIETNDKKVFKITAVIKDIPKNSHFNFDFLFSMKNADYQWGQFLSHNFHTYILLRKGTHYKAFEHNFKQYIDKYVMPQAKQFMQIGSMEEFRKAGNEIEYSLIPLTKIHLHSDRNFDLSPSGNIQYVYIFSIVALFILVIACINFINLTTARSMKRAKEVSIRKVLGTQRKYLIFQFLAESSIMSLFSMFIALGLSLIALPYFNIIALKKMSIADLATPGILPFIVILPFAVGLLSGSYPAFFLSSFKPIESLKGKMGGKIKTVSLRSILVVFQFALAIFLIAGTIVVYKQLNYIQTKNLGYDRNEILVINNLYSLKNNAELFKKEIISLPGVRSGTMSSFLPVSSSSRTDNSYSKEAVMDAKSGFNMQTWVVDYDYIRTLGLQVKMGRNFSPEFGTDSNATIINETTATLLGYENPLGKKIYSQIGGPNGNKEFTIIGVVKNFNFETLHQAISPLALFLGNSNGLCAFKIQSTQIPMLIKNIGTKWKSLTSDLPFSYRFLDDSFNEMYQSDQRVGEIALLFSFLAILIACLGLFGLATFITEQRVKEIGIRKILGASVRKIVQLLSKEFIQLVVLSFLIAVPISWYFMHKWLNDYAYRVEINWRVYLLSGFIALFIAIITVGYHAIKAALINPIRNLRVE